MDYVYGIEIIDGRPDNFAPKVSRLCLDSEDALRVAKGISEQITLRVIVWRMSVSKPGEAAEESLPLASFRLGSSGY